MKPLVLNGEIKKSDPSLSIYGYVLYNTIITVIDDFSMYDPEDHMNYKKEGEQIESDYEVIDSNVRDSIFATWGFEIIEDRKLFFTKMKPYYENSNRKNN